MLTKSHRHFTISGICKKQAAEFKQPNEAVSKPEQKTSLINQDAKCFRCDNQINPK